MQIMFQIEHVRCYVAFFRLNVGSFFVLAISSCIFGGGKEFTFQVGYGCTRLYCTYSTDKLHSITTKLDQDPMRVPRKVVFIIVLTDTICTTQKACREMSILLQLLLVTRGPNFDRPSRNN